MLEPSYAGLYLLSQLNIIGWVLVIVSLYFSSRVYGEGGIFRYAIYSVASIVGGIILALVLAIIGIVFAIKGAAPLTGVFFIIVAIVTILASIVLMGYYMYKSLSLLAEKSGEPLFKAAGITMLIAAVTMIILVGVLVELVGAIILAIAFYTLKPPIIESMPSETQTKT